LVLDPLGFKVAAPANLSCKGAVLLEAATVDCCLRGIPVGLEDLDLEEEWLEGDGGDRDLLETELDDLLDLDENLLSLFSSLDLIQGSAQSSWPLTLGCLPPAWGGLSS